MIVKGYDMGRNHEVTEAGMLLDESGNLREPGWSRTMVQEYKRSMIKAPKWRLKEWDYYIVMSDRFGAAFTISDDGYIGLQSVSLLEFGLKPWEHTETVLNAFPMGKTRLPLTSKVGVSKYIDKRLRMRFDAKQGMRRIRCQFKDFFEGKTFKCDITLIQPEMDTIVIATPWDKKKHFYYNQKINCMRASGYMQLGDKRYEFNPLRNFGTLDWGRGVWTYDNTWFWGSGNSEIDGKPFGFNIGYGFCNTSAASENVIFYDGIAHKLDDVTFHIPESGYTDPWKITSSDGRFETEFISVLDRAANLDYKVIVSDQHQVFGKMSGTVILDDGTELKLKDIMCFCEKVHNRY